MYCLSACALCMSTCKLVLIALVLWPVVNKLIGLSQCHSVANENTPNTVKFCSFCCNWSKLCELLIITCYSAYIYNGDKTTTIMNSVWPWIFYTPHRPAGAVSRTLLTALPVVDVTRKCQPLTNWFVNLSKLDHSRTMAVADVVCIMTA